MANQRFAQWMADRRMALKPVPSQAALSEVIGVSQEAVSKWEREGVMSLPPKTIRQIARAFGVDPVEVAEALGYPTRKTQVFTLPMPPHVLEERISALSLRLGKEVEEWAIETFPAGDEGREPNARNGGRS